MDIVEKIVISNREPECKRVFWYYPVTKQIYRWFADGWQSIGIPHEDIANALKKIDEIHEITPDTNEQVRDLSTFLHQIPIYMECTEQDIENMFPSTYTVGENMPLWNVDVNHPTISLLQSSLLLYGLTINYK